MFGSQVRVLLGALVHPVVALTNNLLRVVYGDVGQMVRPLALTLTSSACSGLISEFSNVNN
jgi:hypothetical protein